MLIKITQPYTSPYPNPISFDAGGIVKVEREDLEHPGWFWCHAPSGKTGWVHRSFLAACSGTTTSLRAYSAQELTVTGGEQGTLIQQLDGWAQIRLDTGAEGWLPTSHIQALPTNL
jgi:SH3-like domain-containing protein